jgi:hypothetical protein
LPKDFRAVTKPLKLGELQSLLLIWLKLSINSTPYNVCFSNFWGEGGHPLTTPLSVMFSEGNGLEVFCDVQRGKWVSGFSVTCDLMVVELTSIYVTIKVQLPITYAFQIFGGKGDTR